MNNKNVTSMLVELSGGMDFNIGLDKVKSDEEKIIKQFVKILKKAKGTELPCQLYMRYHGKSIISTIYSSIEWLINKNIFIF